MVDFFYNVSGVFNIPPLCCELAQRHWQKNTIGRLFQRWMYKQFLVFLISYFHRLLARGESHVAMQNPIIFFSRVANVMKVLNLFTFFAQHSIVSNCWCQTLLNVNILLHSNQIAVRRMALWNCLEGIWNEKTNEGNTIDETVQRMEGIVAKFREEPFSSVWVFRHFVISTLFNTTNNTIS